MSAEEESDSIAPAGLKKVILNSGSQKCTFVVNSKATFHFCTKVYDKNVKDNKVLDDSRKVGKPMELLFGKQFKMPIWETCLKSMLIGEVAKFTVDKNLVDGYPLVSESYRKFAGISEHKEHEHRCCGMNALKSTNDVCQNLLSQPKDLEFTFELLNVEAPDEYEREAWSMAPDEKLVSLPTLREEGNRLYKESNFKAAAEKYTEALARLEQLVLREKPGEEEWLALEKLKIPLLLNFSQCKLIDKDYYAVIEHTSTVLKQDEQNVKALFRRAKANVGAWNPKEAEADFEKVVSLDPSLKGAVIKELKILKNLQKQKDLEDKLNLQGKMFT